MNYSGTYKWHIDDPTQINRILSAKCGDHLESSVFQIGMNWQIELNPNGWCEGNKGFCAVCVRLLRMPPSWKSIFCQAHIECPQIGNKMVFSDSFTKPDCLGFFISSFKAVQAACGGQQLTFLITIHIARITLKQNNKIKFQMQTNEYKKNSQLQLKIDEPMMQQLKLFDKGKGICSDICDNVWCLKLYPNGHWTSREGDVYLRLQLCALPPNVSKMTVQWTVYCEGENININQTFINDFDEQNRRYVWTENTVSFADFCKYNTWTVGVNIKVLNVFDMNGQEITDTAWSEHKESQNDDKTLAVMPYDDDALKAKLQFYDTTMQSLSMKVEQMQKTLHSLSGSVSQMQNQMEESKEEENSLSEMRRQMSVLQHQVNGISSANSQQQTNPKHEKVREWFRKEVDLEQYYALFIENGFEDLQSIKALNMDILNMMQIDKIGHKMKILRCVAKLNHSQNEGSTAYMG